MTEGQSFMDLTASTHNFLREILAEARAANVYLGHMAALLESQNESLEALVEFFTERTVVGIAVHPGTPTVHHEGGSNMTVTLVKKSALKHKGTSKLARGVKAPGDFVFVDNEDDTATVQGIDAAGNPVDISGVATLAVTSSDTSIVTVDAPVGMQFKMSAVGPVTASPVTISATATWNDGSSGPFKFDLPVTVIAGGPTGIKIVPGVPVTRP